MKTGVFQRSDSSGVICWLAYTVWTLSESMRWKETMPVEWIELIRKAHGGGWCPPALTKAELLSNRKLKNSCNAESLVQAIVIGLGLSPVWTPATEKQLFPPLLLFGLFYLSPTTNKRSITVSTKAKPRGFFVYFFLFLQYLSLYYKSHAGNMHEDDKLHN